MASLGDRAVGLASLADWLNDTTDSVAFDTLFGAWVRDSGWQSAGFGWPIEGNPILVVMAQPDSTEIGAGLPPDVSELCVPLRSETTAVPRSPNRRVVLLTVPGRTPGVLWVDKAGSEPWTEEECSYLRLSAKVMERSATLANQIGPTIDPDRLNQRLGDVALISGRLAHDFDNILTGIIGFSDLTAPLLEKGSQPAKFVAEIAKVGYRGTIFTQQLHQLSRCGQGKPQAGSVSLAVAKEEARLRGNAPNGPRIDIQVPDTLPSVAMDATSLGIVCGHLLENAIEAVPAAGSVAINARIVELNRPEATGFLGKVEAGPHLEVSVRDFGPGIKPDVRKKLFAEPFFTTKVRHRGLGLAIVYRTLYAHCGGIRIEPADPGPGTLARIVLPVAGSRTAVVPVSPLGGISR